MLHNDDVLFIELHLKLSSVLARSFECICQDIRIACWLSNLHNRNLSQQHNFVVIFNIEMQKDMEVPFESKIYGVLTLRFDRIRTWTHDLRIINRTFPAPVVLDHWYKIPLLIKGNGLPHILHDRDHSTKKASNHHANLPLEMYSFTL